MASHYDLYSLDTSSSGTPSTASMVQTSPLTVLVLFGGISTCYIAYAVLQEALYRMKACATGEYFQYTCFFLLCQSTICLLVSRLLVLVHERRDSAKAGRQLPALSLSDLLRIDRHNLVPYASCGFSCMGAMFFSNEALKYVNYPTQALAKTCKVVPVSLFFDLVGDQRTNNIQHSISIIIIALGMSLFLQHDVVEKFEAFPMAGGKASLHYDTDDASKSLYGNVLLFLSLCLDGATSATQRHIKNGGRHIVSTAVVSSRGPPTTHELMLAVNVWAFVFIAGLALASGQVSTGFAYCRSEPRAAVLIGLASLLSAAGQMFTYYTLVHFDPSILAFMTSLRKLASIYLSILLFDNTLSHYEVVGIGIVFLGILLPMLSNRSSGNDDKI